MKKFFSSSQNTSQTAAKLASVAVPLSQLQDNNYEDIAKAVGNAEVVLIGEATHGTEEFYRTRAHISKILIEKYGFNFVAVEADFPDANRVNRFVHGGDLKTGDKTADDALEDFQRFPQWMWRNHATKDFIEWLRQFNEKVEQQPHHRKRLKAGFFGLDLYSLFSSADSVIKYLQNVDQQAAEIARNRYGTLGMFRDSSLHDYAYAIEMGIVESQKEKVIAMLVDLMKNAPDYIRKHGGFLDGDEYFFSEQNAKLVKDAEEYYRKSFAGGVVTWNIRDSHMTDTLQALLKYYHWKSEKQRKQLQDAIKAHDVGAGTTTLSADVARHEEVEGDVQGAPRVANVLDIPADIRERKAEKLLSPDVQEHLIEGDVTHPVDLAHPPRIRAIVWAHNSHLGDARATEFGAMKECNVGQLARERLGIENTFSIGFTTHHGTVSAAQRWDGARETMSVNPGLPNSYEDLFHQATEFMNNAKDDESQQARGEEAQEEENGFALLLRSNNPKVSASQEAVKLLIEPRIERAIGVQYVKRTERQSHYIKCCLPKQFDFLIHIDETTALKPLD